MTKTLYETQNGNFTNAAHLAARRLIYPALFNAPYESLTFVDTQFGAGDERGRVLDGQCGVDRIIEVSAGGLRGALTFTVQERFRRSHYLADYGNRITVTEWNGASGQPGELYKVIADFLVFAFFDEEAEEFQNVSVVDLSILKWMLAWGLIEFSRASNTKGQDYLEFFLDDLHSAEGRTGVMLR